MLYSVFIDLLPHNTKSCGTQLLEMYAHYATSYYTRQIYIFLFLTPHNLYLRRGYIGSIRTMMNLARRLLVWASKIKIETIEILWIVSEIKHADGRTDMIYALSIKIINLCLYLNILMIQFTK